MMRPALYWHTLRHLKPVQLWGRIVHSVRHPLPDGAPPPPLRTPRGPWVAPPPRPPTQLDGRRFRFLNVEREVASAADWNHPGWEKLWLYNLHYFDDLAAVGFRDTAERWIAENPPADGNGWEPYPLSLRIVNWIKWSLAGGELSAPMRHSLAIQCRQLAQRIEWHLLGNHLFANAKALVFAGCFFEGDQARHWLARGLAILERERAEQILADGAHFELSPMYHAIILEDMLDLVNLARACPGAFQPEPFAECAALMLGWLARVTHPDGDIAFFNDAALGIASRPADIEAYGARLGIAEVAAAAGGAANYLRLQSGAACVLLDVAPVGPDYIPGHAHADTLSFELSLGDERVIVNSGTSTYAPSSERLRQRSTAAHSTLEIDGENSSEVWGSFRVARRARPFALSVSRETSASGGVESEACRVSCAHDGYRRLSGRPVHRREWRLAAGTLTVTDSVDGRFSRAIARFHFHPDCALLEHDGNGGVLRTGRGGMVRWSIEGGHGRVVETTYHPRFGVVLPNRCLEVETVDRPVATHFNWGG